LGEDVRRNLNQAFVFDAKELIRQNAGVDDIDDEASGAYEHSLRCRNGREEPR
jgi:hypothetical protein